MNNFKKFNQIYSELLSVSLNEAADLKSLMKKRRELQKELSSIEDQIKKAKNTASVSGISARKTQEKGVRGTYKATMKNQAGHELVIHHAKYATGAPTLSTKSGKKIPHPPEIKSNHLAQLKTWHKNNKFADHFK